MPDGALRAREIRARASPRELLESDAAWASTGAFVTLYVAGEMHKWFARPPLAAVARAACEVLPFLPSPSPFVIGASCAESAPSARTLLNASRTRVSDDENQQESCIQRESCHPAAP